MLTAISSRAVDLADRWFPDAYIIALCGVVAVSIAAVLNGASLMAVSIAFGDGFWSLAPFTLQMAYVAIGGFVVATSPVATRLLKYLASRPRSGRAAVIYVAGFSIALSLLNWGLSLIFSGLLVRELARRTDLTLDYRAAGAAAYLGLGCGFTLGLSSSAAQIQANPSSIPASLLPVTGVIGFADTIFTWQNGLTIGVLTSLSLAVCYWSAPIGTGIRTAEDLGIENPPAAPLAPPRPARPGDYLAKSPILTIVIVALGLGWVIHNFLSNDPIAAISGLNTYNFVFLLLGILLHWRPDSLLQAFSRAVPSIGGVLLQFPFYAGIAQILTVPHGPTGDTLSHTIAQFFISASAGTTSFAAVVGLYSAALGFFIPSAGAKWIIEAPYIAAAANEIGAHLGWTVMVYNIAETLPNFINPFWMLPLLGILGLKAKDLVGFTVIQFIVHFPVAIALGALLMRTFEYRPPQFR
ncbi:TIGR00366 family protein [Kaistia terrae]|nr:TIGR00366 family protein [Kaistia terrae]MCX5581715.1 TIGR00366 family protein [Kaistia terrae]